MTDLHTPECTDCGCDETCTAPLPPEIHEHTRACFATGCPAIREAHREQSQERFARVAAAVARELDGLGLTPGDFYADSIAGVAIDAIFPPTDGPQPGDARPVACGCVDGMGRIDRSCHSYGLCLQKMRDMADRAKAQRPSYEELQTAAYHAMQPEGSRPECSVFHCSAEGAQFTDDQQWVCPEHRR